MTRLLIVQALACALVGFGGPSVAQEAGEPSAKEGWVEKAFEFSAPDLDFKTLVPDEAKVAFVPMKAREENTIGSIKIIGEVPAIDTAEVPVRVTILGYDLRTSGGADRICTRVQTEEGYRQVEEKATRHRSDVMSLAFKYVDGLAADGIISRCLTRGHQALAVNFLFSLAKAKTDEDRSATFEAAENYAMTFTDNMAFENGEDGGYWDSVKEVPLRIGGKTIDLRIPDDWDVPINDFDGRPTAELHILKQDGKVTKGGAWLLAADMAAKPDLEKVGSEAIPLFLRLQFQGQQPGALKLEETSAGSGPGGKGALVQHFLFSLTGEDGTTQSSARAMMVWHEGRLYTLIRWSPYVEDGSQNAFFSMLPVLTIYDSFAATVHDLVIGEG
jgi:hypothetical protein